MFVGALLVSTALGRLPAMAQSTGASDGTAAPPPAIQEVVVTGSRIPRINEKSANPVAVVTSQEQKLQGTTHVEDLLNTLPQVNAGLNGGALGPTGTATVDLRGFGAFRTLVLINGRRLNPGDPLNPSADLNSVPGSLVKRVEVLTGGASSIYGSDAIAGVVNFVMDDNFTGLQMQAQYSGYLGSGQFGDLQALSRANGFNDASGNRLDGGTLDVSAAFGHAVNGDKGHITLYGGYRRTNPVSASTRDYSACNLIETANFFGCIRDNNTNPAQFQTSSGGAYTIDPATGNTLRNYDNARDGFNTAPYAYLQRPDTRYDAGLFARYDFSPMFKSYLEFQYSNDRTTARYDPANTALNTFGVNCNNPLLSADEVTQFCNGLAATDTAQLVIGKRATEGGARYDELRHASYRGVLGLKGQLDPVWSYDAFVQYGITYSDEHLSGDLSLQRTANALNVVSVGGTPTCQSVVDGTDPACVPYNIFAINAVSPAAARYVRADAHQHGFASRSVAGGDFVGLLGHYGIKSPFASEGVGVVVGGEARREAVRNTPDAAYSSGDLAVAGQLLPFTGAYTVGEVYGEMHVPLLENLPLISRLSLDLSDRYAMYNLQGDVNAYKVGGDWAVDDDVRLRGSVSQAIRAPNGFELFKANAIAKFQGADPCAGATPIANRSQCRNSGVTDAQYGTIPDTGNFNYLTGGNTKLTPETATTYTVGVVLTPRFFRGFSLSVDYWKIKVKKYDGSYAPNLTLNNCIFNGSPIFCPLVQRDANGSLSLGNGLTSGRVIATNLNTGSYGESGVDLDSSYSLPLERVGLRQFGRVDFHFSGSLALDNTILLIPGAPLTDCTGLYGPTCTGIGPTSPIPRWRHEMRVTWALPSSLDLSLNWRHVGELKSELASSYTALAATPFPVDARIRPFDYFDFTVSYDITPQYNLRVGVDNIFGVRPPVAGSNANPLILPGNMVASTYDTFGRYMFVGITAKY